MEGSPDKAQRGCPKPLRRPKVGKVTDTDGASASKVGGTYQAQDRIRGGRQWSTGENRFETPVEKDDRVKVDVTANSNASFQKSGLNAEAKEFVPNVKGSNLDTSVDESLATNSADWSAQAYLTECDPLMELEEAMNNLTEMPGYFNDIADHLTQVFLTSLNDSTTLEILVDCIFEKSLNDANFRYLGARLLDYLSYTVTTCTEDKILRTVILNRLSRVRNESDQMITTDPVKFRNFTLFLAEMFNYFGIYTNDVKARIRILGLAVVDLLALLADTDDKENLETTVQILKMCGGSLEESEKSGSETKTSPNLDALMDKIATKVEKVENHSSKIALMLKGVLDLRKRNWDMTTEDIQNSFQQAPYATWTEDDFTEEELRFMEEQMGNNSSENDDPEFSREIEEAYEEFLKSNN